MTRSSTRPHPSLLAPLLLLVPACSGSGEDTDQGARSRAPDEAFAAAEERLMEASVARVDFRITATGSVEADLSGTLLLAEGGRARLEGEGTFGGDEVSLLLVSDGERMRMTNGRDTAEAETPARLNEALVVGLTRMGVLHNLARLTKVAPPDHADGGVRRWVEAVEFRTEERGSIGFDFHVSGEPSGTARLFLSPGTGLPGERRQTVEFPEGQMQVTELYGTVSVGAGADPAAFELD